MRENEFTSEIKAQVLKRADYCCERCWSENDLECHHRLALQLGGTSTLENCIVLCHNCHNIAPQDPFLFHHFFLRFASTKELVKYYNVFSEEDAIEAFCREENVDFKETFNKLKDDPGSHVSAIKDGMEQCVKQKGHAGFNIPYGYTYNQGELKVYPEEARIVKDIYQWYLEGNSLGSICEMLNSAQVRSKRGCLWVKKCISAILKNPVYCGYHRWRNHLVKANHETIIDPAVFNQIQQKLMLRHGMPFILELK